MKLWLNKCPKCYDNIYLDEETNHIVCEGCGYKEKAKTRKDLNLLLKNWGMPEDYGPKENRQTLTPAGAVIVRSYEETDMVRGEEVLPVVGASRGLLTDKEKLEGLRKGGFILCFKVLI